MFRLGSRELPAFVLKARNRLTRKIRATSLNLIPTPLQPEAKRDKRVAADITSYEQAAGFAHRAGSMPLRTLLRMEALLAGDSIVSAETGCGKSTIFFSRISSKHKVFCLDDRSEGDTSSVAYFANCPATRMDRIETIFGPTQATLPIYQHHEPYDLVLIDGPHGYPFPEIEYYFFYPHLKSNGLLVVDDVHIPTIGRLADFISEDRMFERIELIGSTAVFRRTDAPVFDPFGDGWWLQDYNRRRADFAKQIYLQDDKRLPPIDFEGNF
jgi:predicted O-methyltransferase YrrM